MKLTTQPNSEQQVVQLVRKTNKMTELFESLTPSPLYQTHSIKKNKNKKTKQKRKKGMRYIIYELTLERDKVLEMQQWNLLQLLRVFRL